MWWIIAGWLACAIAFVPLRRLLARLQTGRWNELRPLWDGHDRAISVVVLSLGVPLAPLALAVLVALVILAAAKRGSLARLRGEIMDPFAHPSSEWLERDRESFIADLVRRRQRVDSRLKRDRIGEWPMWKFDHVPEAMMVDVVAFYLQLHAAGVPDHLIWEKLEAYRAEHGEGRLPGRCTLLAYVRYRLVLEDEAYLGLGDEFVAQQTALSEQYAHHRISMRKDKEWPPREWLRERLTIAEFEQLGAGTDPNASDAPAMLFRGTSRTSKDLVRLKVLMLPDDEIWTFSSPTKSWQGLAGRAGIALIRNGRVISHVITAMN